MPKPGKYWILAEPIGGKKVQALGNAVVLGHSAAPEVGERAIPSKNPILRPGVDPKTVTTAEPPDRSLLRTTVAAAMAAGRPFVVTFATPLYCQTRTCGPVVQVVQSVAEDRQRNGVDFIHIEIYKGNDPGEGHNRWVDEWKLRSEPFTFVVDRRASSGRASRAPSAPPSSSRPCRRSHAELLALEPAPTTLSR